MLILAAFCSGSGPGAPLSDWTSKETLANSAAAPLPKSPESAWQGSGTILLVDDEETVRAVSGKLLGALGLGVLYAEDGLEAALPLEREAMAEIKAALGLGRGDL
mgnify:CR=1 FL=1